MRRYTKADLEALVFCQLENLEAVHDLLRLMKQQNELLAKANRRLKEAVSEEKPKPYKSVGRLNRPAKK